MYSVAISYIWWPGLDKAIVEVVKSCTSCQAVAPVQPWTWPNQLWKRIHMDFNGPFKTRCFLLLSMLILALNAHSKWPEVFVIKETTPTKIIEILIVSFLLSLNYRSRLLWTMVHNLYWNISSTS